MTTRFRERFALSPNHHVSPAHERKGVLVHHSVMAYEATIARMQDSASEVSYHVLISSSGERCTLVPDIAVAWHAGASDFRGRKRCNDFLLGLAFAGDTYREPLSPEQIDSSLEWLAQRWAALGWTTDWVIDHRQVAPGRKDDLNPVEWARFQAALRARFGPG